MEILKNKISEIVGGKANTLQLQYIFYNLKILTASSSDFVGHIKSPEACAELDKLFEKLCTNYISYISAVEREVKGVQSLTPLGDSHRGGRRTLLLNLEGNKRLIFKPISSHFTIFIGKLLEFFNNENQFNFYEARVVLNTDHYSIMEYVCSEQIKDQELYAYHYGALMVLIYLFRGVDFHYENILNTRNVPVPIDCETLFYPLINGVKNYDITATLLIPFDIFHHSVLQKQELPLQSIRAGIHDAFRLVEASKAHLLALFEKEYGKLTRVIFKPTSYYHKLLETSLHPGYIADRKKRERFVRESLTGTHPISRVVLNDEVEDILQCDIPYFYWEGGCLYSSRGRALLQGIVSESRQEIINNFNYLNECERHIKEAIDLIMEREGDR